MVFEHQGLHVTREAAIALMIDYIPQVFRGWGMQAEQGSGMCDGATNEECDHVKALKNEHREIR